MAETTTPPAEGWAYPSVMGACHYFGTDRRSLCGRWAFFGALEADDGVPRQRDCGFCRKKLAKRSPSPRPAPSDGAPSREGDAK